MQMCLHSRYCAVTLVDFAGCWLRVSFLSGSWKEGTTGIKKLEGTSF